MDKSLVACLCPSCKGKLVTPYKRRLHTRMFVRNTSGMTLSSRRGLPSAAVRSGPRTEQINTVFDSSTSKSSTLDCCPGPVQANVLDQYGGPDDNRMDTSSDNTSSTDQHSSSEDETCDVVDDPHDDTVEVERSTSPVVESSDQVGELDFDIDTFPSIVDDECLNSPLYTGAHVTVIQAVVEHLLWFTQHPHISKDAFSDMLYMQHYSTLPNDNLLPCSYNDIRRKIEPYLVKPVVFDCCPNDCIVFRGENLYKDECPVCESKRYNSKRQAMRRFTYLPVGPRLIRLFGTSNLAKLVQSHSTVSSSSAMFDVQDSPSWCETYRTIFCGDPRGISFALNTDGPTSI